MYGLFVKFYSIQLSSLLARACNLSISLGNNSAHADSFSTISGYASTSFKKFLGVARIQNQSQAIAAGAFQNKIQALPIPCANRFHLVYCHTVCLVTLSIVCATSKAFKS
jgi:hypothetical protein